MSVRDIAFTMYPVTDMPRAVTFYSDVLGLPQGELSSDVWTEFEIAGKTFGVGNFPQVGSPGSAQSLSLEIDDLPAFLKHLASHGVEATEPHDLANCSLSVVRDPDGNQIWLHQSKRR